MLFKKINKDRVGLTALELFNAALTGQEPTAIATKRAVERAGLVLPHTGASSVDNQDFYRRCVTCHGTVWKCTAVYGEDNMARALSLLKNTWPDSKDALGAVPLGALATLIGSQGDKIDDERFIAMVGRKPVLAYLQEAKSTIFTHQYGFSRAVVRQYNKRLARRNHIRTKLNEDDESQDELKDVKEKTRSNP